MPGAVASIKNVTTRCQNNGKQVKYERFTSYNIDEVYGVDI